jgi:hypothetical protein
MSQVRYSSLPSDAATRYRKGLSGRVVLNRTASETRELARLGAQDQALWSTLSRAVTPTRERLEEREAGGTMGGTLTCSRSVLVKASDPANLRLSELAGLGDGRTSTSGQRT